MGIESKMKLFVALAALVGFASAGCPNGCSGHGSCGTSDVCGCYKGFFGGDCSYRYCPVGPSWTVTPIEKLLDDRYSEAIVLNTPGGYVGHNKFDKLTAKQYPITTADFTATFQALYPKRPNFNQYTSVSSCEVYNVGGPEWFDESGEKQTLNLKAKFTELANKQKANILGAANTANAGTTYEDFQPCSSKGDCDVATGTCTCNAGHYGEACEKQSTYY